MTAAKREQPVGEMTTGDWSGLPLAINITGPMFLCSRETGVDVWFPHLASDRKHQVAIGTDLGSVALGPDEDQFLGIYRYRVDGIPPSETCGPHNPSGSTPYCTRPRVKEPYYCLVHVHLPKPLRLIGLSPVICTVTEEGASLGQHSMPTGYRLIYARNHHPVVRSDQSSSVEFHLPFDPAKEERQLEMFLSYDPFDFSDNDEHKEAKADFRSIGHMIGRELEVEIDTFKMAADITAATPYKILVGPHQDCKAPAIQLG